MLSFVLAPCSASSGASACLLACFARAELRGTPWLWGCLLLAHPCDATGWAGLSSAVALGCFLLLAHLLLLLAASQVATELPDAPHSGATFCLLASSFCNLQYPRLWLLVVLELWSCFLIAPASFSA